jgi:hypothetical protein
MLTEPRTYAPTLAETTRFHIETVTEALMQHTGVSQTFVSKVCRPDPAFLKRLWETTMNVATYDDVMARLSAIWPDDAEWPESVPRPAPGSLSDEIRAEFAEKAAKARAAKAQTEAREAARRSRALRHAAAGGAQAPAHP